MDFDQDDRNRLVIVEAQLSILLDAVGLLLDASNSRSPSGHSWRDELRVWSEDLARERLGLDTDLPDQT